MSRPSSAPTRRALLLACCVIVGGAAAAIGRSFSGQNAWLLAVPAAVALGWLLVARPDECEPGRHGADQDQPRPRP